MRRRGIFGIKIAGDEFLIRIGGVTLRFFEKLFGNLEVIG